MKVLTALFEWRDDTARLEDESVRYVLPNHMLLRISELVPQDSLQLFSCCNPQPPPLVKSNASEIIRIILDAISEPKKITEKVTVQQAAPRPISIQLPTLSQPTLPSPVTPEITQDQLFKQADWFTGPKRSAAFLPLGAASPSSSASFFQKSPAAPVADANKQKMSQVAESLAASFNFGINIVPASIEEIYQLSNTNKKRNKEKKQLKEDSINAGPVSPIKYGDE